MATEENVHDGKKPEADVVNKENETEIVTESIPLNIGSNAESNIQTVEASAAVEMTNADTISNSKCFVDSKIQSLLAKYIRPEDAETFAAICHVSALVEKTLGGRRSRIDTVLSVLPLSNTNIRLPAVWKLFLNYDTLHKRLSRNLRLTNLLRKFYKGCYISRDCEDYLICLEFSTHYAETCSQCLRSMSARSRKNERPCDHEFSQTLKARNFRNLACSNDERFLLLMRVRNLDSDSINFYVSADKESQLSLISIVVSVNTDTNPEGFRFSFLNSRDEIACSFSQSFIVCYNIISW